MGKAVRLYPYAASSQLSLALSDFDDPQAQRAISVRELRQDPLGEENGDSPSGYDVSADSDWSKLSFRLTARLPEAELGRILPNGSDLAADVLLLVSLTCQATKFRHAVHLKLGSQGRWTGFATVQRADLRGALLLRPQLVRATRIPVEPGLHEYAVDPGAIIASGPTVTFYIDNAPRAESGSIPITWEDFANSINVWRRQHASDVFYLEPFGPEPILYLNSRYAQLRDILDSKSRRGPEAAMRDMAATMIGMTVWSQLIYSAFAAVSYDEATNSGSAPMEGWRGTVLKTCLPRLYPEEPDLEQALNRLALDLSESDGRASVIAKVGSVTQDLVSNFKVVETAIRAFEMHGDREEATE